ncbi:MAG: DsbA family protein [Nitrospiria bacterium]
MHTKGFFKPLWSLLVLAPIELIFLTKAMASNGNLLVPGDEYLKHLPGSVEVVVFIDFYSDDCYRFEKDVLSPLQKRYGNQVLIKTVGLLGSRQESEKLIPIYYAARNLGKGDEMRRHIFKTTYETLKGQESITLPKLIQGIGLDPGVVIEMARSSLIQEEFRAGLVMGKRFGIKKTPGVLLNGTLLEDWSLNNLSTQIEAALPSHI